MPYILKTTESFTVCRYCRYSTHFCFPLCFTSSISWSPTTLGLWQECAGAERGVTVSERGVMVSEHDFSGASLCPGGRTRWDGMTREAEVATWDYSLAHRDWRPRKKREKLCRNGWQAKYIRNSSTHLPGILHAENVSTGLLSGAVMPRFCPSLWA